MALYKKGASVCIALCSSSPMPVLPFARPCACFTTYPCSKCFWRMLFGKAFLYGPVLILCPFTTFEWFSSCAFLI